MKQPVEHRAGRLHLGCGRVGFLHLSENLRLADHERVEPGGDAEQMTRDVQIGDLVRMRHELGTVHAVELAHEGQEARARQREVVARGVQLRTVAGRQDDRLARRAALGQRPQRAIEAPRLEVEALAQLDRRGAMADSDQEEMQTENLKPNTQKLWLFVRK